MFYQEITWLGQTGISTGWPDGTFRPSQNIERAAIAAYFYRMAGSPDVVLPKQSPFTDVAPSDPFYKEIVWMHQQHITTGWSDGTFRPHDSVTREALAAFFYRAANMNDDAAPTQDPFKDVTSKSRSTVKSHGLRLRRSRPAGPTALSVRTSPLLVKRLPHLCSASPKNLSGVIFVQPLRGKR